jgi:hypothetical protein
MKRRFAEQKPRQTYIVKWETCKRSTLILIIRGGQHGWLKNLLEIGPGMTMYCLNDASYAKERVHGSKWTR